MAAALKIPRNTAYELAYTLEEENLLRVTGDGRLLLGVRTFELGARFAQSLDLLTEGMPIVSRLRDQSEETVHLAILDGRHAVYLAKEESRQFVRMSSAPGLRLPAHLAAVGKAMLAALPLDELRAKFAGVKLEAMTANSITDFATLLGDLEATRLRGYAVDNQELSLDVACVGAAVRDAGGGVVAGLSISAPIMRVDESSRLRLAELVIAGAADLSERLGYQR